MLGALVATDRWLGQSRPGWLWIGQLGLVVLGVHLGADRLDDLLVHAAVQIAGLSGDAVAPRAAVFAVAIELAVVARAAWVLLSSVGGPEPSREAWWDKRSVEAFVRPAFWATTALAGAWVVAVAVQDVLAGWWLPGATAASWLVGAVVAWRLGWSGLRKVVGGLFPPKRRIEGVVWAPLLVAVSALAAVALPLRGLLP